MLPIGSIVPSLVALDTKLQGGRCLIHIGREGGVLSKGAFWLAIKKVVSAHAATKGDGLTQAEVLAIEESPQRPSGIPIGVQGSGNQWEIIVDFLYRDALDMMVGLAQDATQMQQAEARFQAGTYVWRP